ncbi:hypothetical protein OG264_16890 [Streptomyces xanthophaeus]|uniref:hypothetical protein n=1 Tax=Streptomyces xanthophaeus TaxID=67385 RepID=UPI00386C805D|nr:hypothetical protein OG264_16890 [Streptomyces xanthophaeus]WST62004.1 hypothetical protein OG605_21545 [Streptomyces xanthophaeus]
MHRTKPSRARILVPSALAAAIFFGAAAPASALDDGDRAVAPRAAAGPVDDLVKGILDAIKALLPAGVTLPDIKIPEITLPEIKLPAIPGVELPQIPGVELPALPPLEPPALPDPAAPVELVPEIPGIPDIPEIPDLADLPGLSDLPGLPAGTGGLP